MNDSINDKAVCRTAPATPGSVEYLSELVVLPAVDDNAAAGVEDQEKVGDDSQEVPPAPNTVSQWQQIHLVLFERLFSFYRNLKYLLYKLLSLFSLSDIIPPSHQAGQGASSISPWTARRTTSYRLVAILKQRSETDY